MDTTVKSNETFLVVDSELNVLRKDTYFNCVAFKEGYIGGRDNIFAAIMPQSLEIKFSELDKLFDKITGWFSFGKLSIEQHLKLHDRWVLVSKYPDGSKMKFSFYFRVHKGMLKFYNWDDDHRPISEYKEKINLHRLYAAIKEEYDKALFMEVLLHAKIRAAFPQRIITYINVDEKEIYISIKDGSSIILHYVIEDGLVKMKFHGFSIGDESYIDTMDLEMIESEIKHYTQMRTKWHDYNTEFSISIPVK